MSSTVQRHTEATPPSPAPSTPPPQRAVRSDRWWWPLGVAVGAVAAGLIPLLFDRNYYYVADTAEGSYGSWYALGTALRDGHWPLLSPDRWMGGNYAAEGQVGLVSPVTMLIGLATTVVSNPVLVASVVKIVFLLVGALGAYVVTRSLGVSQPFAALAGVAAPLGGFTLYMDAPSWVTNLMVWAFFPWCWWGLRRLAAGYSPVYILVFGYLTVSVGYVHGVLMLVILFAAQLVELLRQRNHRALLPTLLSGAAVGFIALAIFLPGVLTQKVTIRDTDQIANDGFLVADLTGFAMSVIPTSLPQVRAWWGLFSPGPVLYIAWFTPLLTIVDWRRSGEWFRRLLVPLIVLTGALMIVLGPSYLGVLRFPTRLMAYVVLIVVVVTATLVDRVRLSEITRGRSRAALAWVAGATYLAWSSSPDQWKVQLGTGALVFAAVAASLLLLRRATSGAAPRAATAAAVFMAVCSVGFVGVQHHFYNGTQTSSSHRYPSSVDGYDDQVRDGVNDLLVVGAASSTSPTTGILGETLVANTWYLNPNVEAQNVYTTISFKAYADQNCMDHLGDTCPELLARLWEKEPTTGLPLVDLLSVDTVQILKSAVPDIATRAVPDGWERVEDGRFGVVWRRLQPMGRAGGVVWTGAGTRTTVVAQDSDRVRLRVDSVGSDRRVVLSRLAWPGYTVTGAELTSPLSGYLLTLDVSGARTGSVVEVAFRPPGFSVSVAAFGVGVALMVALCLWQRGRRSRLPGQRRTGTGEPAARHSS